MAPAVLRTRVRNRWSTLKYLDRESKVTLITLLAQSLDISSKRKKISSGKYYGIWGDDGMSAEEFVEALKAERKFNQEIVEL